jgi:phosphoglycolate phosphatase
LPDSSFPVPGIRLLMFDLDGTLVDSVPDLAAAIQLMLEDLKLPGVDETLVKMWVGNGSAMLVRRALAYRLDFKVQDIDEKLFSRAHELFFHHYRQCNGRGSGLFPGVLDTLEKLQADGLKMAVVTNKPAEFTSQLLIHLAIDRFFPWVISGDTLPRKKPHPEPLLHCAEQAGVLPEECLMVGDSMTDAGAAQAAGIDCVCVSYGYNHGVRFEDEGVKVLDCFSRLQDVGAAG